jgi:hypothetical protein
MYFCRNGVMVRSILSAPWQLTHHPSSHLHPPCPLPHPLLHSIALGPTPHTAPRSGFVQPYDGANGWQLWFLTFHEIPPATRSHALSRQPSLILFSLDLNPFQNMKFTIFFLLTVFFGSPVYAAPAVKLSDEELRAKIAGVWFSEELPQMMRHIA